MNKTSTVVLTMARRFQASPADVYKAWTKPELMKKWLFSTESTNQLARNEFHVGGRWEIIDQRSGEEYRATGEYLEIDPPHRLIFSFEMPQYNELQDRIIVWVSPVEDVCEMTFKQEVVVPHEDDWTDEDLENAIQELSGASEEGWDRMFENLRQLVETGEIREMDKK